MRRFLRGLLFLLVLAALVAGGVYWFAGRGEARRPHDRKARSPRGADRRARGRGRRAGRTVDLADDRARAERQGRFRSSRWMRPSRPRSTRSTAIASASRGQIGKPQRARAAGGRGPDRRRPRRGDRSSICGRCRRPRQRTSRYGSNRRASPLISTHHYLNHGGSEMVVYRATPAGCLVRRPRRRRPSSPGFPAAGAGVAGADDRSRVAFFALGHDDDLATPVGDPGARRGRQRSEHRLRRPRVPEAVPQEPDRARRSLPAAGGARHPDAGAGARPRSARRRSCCRRSSRSTATCGARTPNGSSRSPRRPIRRGCGTGPFVQLGNSQVEASFADHRTYVYHGKEVDRQVHLGFDLAVDGARRRSSRPTPARCCTPAGWASTATASSSTTGWAWRRSTATCRRST